MFNSFFAINTGIREHKNKQQKKIMTAGGKLVLEHTNLADMPSSSNRDHDGRYFPRSVHIITFDGTNGVPVKTDAEGYLDSSLIRNATTDDEGVVQLASETGSSESLVMHQKAVTDALGDVEDTILDWIEVSGVTLMQPNKGYVTNNASRVVLTLPAECEFGKEFGIVGKGVGGWRISQNDGQTIHFCDQMTATGTTGFVNSGSYYDCVRILCITENTDFRITYCTGAVLYLNN